MKSSKVNCRAGQWFAPAHYRLTRVVRELPERARLQLAHEDRQIGNNSAAKEICSVDKSARLLLLVIRGNTHRPATNMQRKWPQNHSNQSFGRARCAPVRQTNSHLPTRVQRLDYKAFAEREQCVFANNAHQLKPQKRKLL